LCRIGALISPPAFGVLRVMNAGCASCLLLLTMTACATETPAPTPGGTAATSQACTETGMASWYSGSSRGRTSRDDLVAAHKTLPLGTSVQVTAIDTVRTATVRINDRGPFGRGRVIDLSTAAAEQLGFRRAGVTPVRLEVDGTPEQTCPFEEARLAPR
jgi:rare lipoprotein A